MNDAEVDIFLELSCFFDDPTNVGNLISGSSLFYPSQILSITVLLVSLMTEELSVHMMIRA